MDTDTQSEMEQGFGADFNNVRIHNDAEAQDMSQNIGAQAFTHGNDIYFNQGKYNPNSDEGKHLLAHELTHTIQQKGMVHKKLMKKDLQSHRFKGDEKIKKVLNGKLIVGKGSQGAHVRIIQQALVDAGFKLPKFGVDGIFGNETKAATKAFQISCGLPKKEQDGVVGKITMGKLDTKYTGYSTEHQQFAGKTDADVLKDSRAITKDEQQAVKDAMSTEVKANPKTGALPTFDVANKAAYKLELKKATEKIAIRQYNALGKGKKAERADSNNLHSPASIDDLAKVSKNETDKVFGNIKKGKPLKFGVNILDGWTKKENDLKGKSKAEQDLIQKGWAEWRIQKIVQGPSMALINEKYGAVQSRGPEKIIVNEVIKELSTTYRKEMIQTHLGWPGFAAGGNIYLQRFKSKTNDGNRRYMWDNFGTIIHEYIHTLEHPASKAYSNTLPEKQGGKVYREGFTDYFTKIVFENINFADKALRQKVEGSFYDATKSDTPTNAYYAEAKNAERVAGIVGINNLMASYFLGQIQYIKGPIEELYVSFKVK
jgi:peptidoglycan hydrolase-like protein with peptidoglycan-binding domain